MSSSSSPVGDQAQTQQVGINYGVVLAAVIFLSMVVLSIFLLYLYAKRVLLGADPTMPTTPSSSSRLFLFNEDDDEASPLTSSRGLSAAVLRALPVTLYSRSKQTSSSSSECAVCLSEVVDGERVRALPKCGHAFHADCIDAWFRSRDTCPLCRAPVAAVVADEAVVEFPAVFPTNVLFWGTHDDVVTTAAPAPAPAPPTTSGRRKEDDLVIDVPTRDAVSANTSRVATTTSSSSPVDEPWSPVSARFRSLRRLLSRGNHAVVGVAGTASTCYNPRSSDVERGFFVGAEPKTATPTN